MLEKKNHTEKADLHGNIRENPLNLNHQIFFMPQGNSLFLKPILGIKPHSKMFTLTGFASFFLPPVTMRKR